MTSLTMIQVVHTVMTLLPALHPNPVDPVPFINPILFEQLGPQCAVSLKGGRESTGMVEDTEVQ